ncbi:DUF7262 family protein [Haloglomus litoreum]|uniref:DUF7262 family protein n=1 Tax=Haloglomus litoreum TaxID=3034026 RepID=UPI0023E88F0D|nr:hypothetical protein [Haloglomus sp. DT116]
MRDRDPFASGGTRSRHAGTSADRGQLSLPVVEAAVGVTLILAVAASLAAGVPAADTRTPQLEAYADDAATVLAGEPPRHQGATRLAEVTRSPEAFERERAALERRVDRILPDNLLYRVETPHGAVGFQRPAGVPVGRATVTSLNGPVTVEVWYA